MPRKAKKISYINGVKHWDCYLCHKILPESAYYKFSQKPHAPYCKKCQIIRNKKDYVPKKRGPYKNLIPNESDHEILKALQGFDSSWTMESLLKAKSQIN